MKTAGITVFVLLVVGAVGYLSQCPCEQIPGAWLLGDEHEGKVTDWSFVNDRDAVRLCQLQVTTWRPHSINLNCMSANGELYLSCSNCAGKNWSQSALSHPNAKLRAGSLLYPVTMERVTDTAVLDEAWRARLSKIDREQSPRPDHWWSFRLVSR